jgi:hypothetical protein
MATGVGTAGSFDMARQRIRQDFVAMAGPVETIVTTIAVEKPSNECFFVCNRDASYHLPTYVLELKDAGRGIYQIDPALRPLLEGLPAYRKKLLVPCVTSLGRPFIWPLRPPEPGRTLDEWSKSSWEAYLLAQKNWINLRSSDILLHYVVQTSERLASLEPAWPALGPQEWYDIAFKGRRIVDADDPIIRRLLHGV